MLLGALDPLARVQDAVGGLDFLWGIVVHVAHVVLMVDCTQSDK